jgi:glutamine kinase
MMSVAKGDLYDLSGTKAETLKELSKLGYNVPEVHFFTVEGWQKNKESILAQVLSIFGNQKLAVRSSTKAEDTSASSMAGAFETLLNVYPSKEKLASAIDKVIASFDEDVTNQVLIQPMVLDVAMSGVIMSKVLDDGSPYHVLNYDDSSGLTDTVTSGSAINKTVYVYNGVSESDFDSPYLLAVLKLIRALESTFPSIPLDIEFAVDNEIEVYLLQVRKITTVENWNNTANKQVSEKIEFLKDYLQSLLSRRPNLYGSKSLLGFMPDWNPAEMIGVVPHPLSMSLYRELITKSTWRIAREQMGYRKMPNVDLMVSLFGRAYIDVRNSFNSFLPEGLEPEICEKLVNAYLERLDKDPHLHDKIEFEVVHTAFDFDFDKRFKENYSDILSEEEFYSYESHLRNLTKKAISNEYSSSINKALRDIDQLCSLQDAFELRNVNKDSFSIADNINTLISECVEFGTLPFSILARHGFIAEGILRSAESNGAISKERLILFKQSIVTVAGNMSQDFRKVKSGEMTKSDYLKLYGHLRPSSYDIISPNYANRTDLFDGVSEIMVHENVQFKLNKEETEKLILLLDYHGLDGISPQGLLDYAAKAIKGREYAKFVFTKHLSSILEFVSEWGEITGFSRSDLSMLNINDVLRILHSPLSDEVVSHFENKISKAKNNYKVASSFKLSYLIRSKSDVYIVPMQRSLPNFVGDSRLESQIVELTPYIKKIPNLNGKIVLIEGADPGYDWIFTRNIGGLVTKYGGANSHMAIRSAEYNIPAAIGCGEQPYQRIKKAGNCLLDCHAKRLEPIVYK